MPTFFRLAGFLLIAGLVMAAIVYFTQVSSDSVDPPEPAVEATPGELGEELEGDFDDEMIEEEESFSDEADNELMDDPMIEADQPPDLEEGEILDDSEVEESEDIELER